jgi:hypothetical protein
MALPGWLSDGFLDEFQFLLQGSEVALKPFQGHNLSTISYPFSLSQAVGWSEKFLGRASALETVS